MYGGDQSMQVLFVRHTEPNYAPITARKYKGHGRDLAPLTETGIDQAYEVALDERFQGAELILSSPYTRALQTAAIISRICDLPLRVEVDLHEWLVDLNFDYDNFRHVQAAAREAEEGRGIPFEGREYHWESYHDLGERAFRVLDRYRGHQKVICVTHGILIRQFAEVEHVPLGGVLEYELPARYRPLNGAGRFINY